MHRHRKRTGVSIDGLLAGRSDAPDGFDIRVLESFYRGAVDEFPDTHLAYVIRLWAELPDRPRGAAGRAAAQQRKRKVDLTPETRAELRAHWRRVGLSVEAFFCRLVNPPSGLSVSMVYRWMSDDAPKRVRQDHIVFVLSAWRSLPDASGRLISTHFIPFEAEAKRPSSGLGS